MQLIKRTPFELKRTPSRLHRSIVAGAALAAAVGCGGGSGEAPPRSAAVTTASRSPAAQQRCAVSVSPDRKLTEIVSQRDGYGVLLPGGTWEVECDEDQILLASSDLMLLVSVVEGDAGAELDPEQYLRAIYERSATQLRAHGWQAAAPRLAEVASQATPSYKRMALFHEVLGVEVQGRPMKSIHAWTTMRSQKQQPLDYHVSWTGPEEAWQEGMLDGLGVMLLSFGPLQG